jgi:hypothetical protein
VADGLILLVLLDLQYLRHSSLIFPALPNSEISAIAYDFAANQLRMFVLPRALIFIPHQLIDSHLPLRLRPKYM